MKIHKQVIFLQLCALILLLVGSAYAEPIKLRFNYSIPLKKSISGSWHWYGDEVEKRTNGQVKFEYFPLSGLFSPKEVRDNIIAGTGDLSNISVSTEGERMPISEITSLPTIIFPDTVEGTIAGSNSAIQLISEFPEIAAEFSDFKVIAFQYLTAYGVFTPSPTYLPSELKGIKMRAAALHADFVAHVGGGPVNITPPQTYMSLKTGVINGSICSITQVSDYKLWEIGKYFTDVYMGRTLFAIIMNKDSWKNLPKDVQKIMDEVSKDMVKKGAEIAIGENEKAKELFLKNGGTIIELTPEQKKAWDEAKLFVEKQWLETMHKKGKGEVSEKMVKRFKEIAAEKTKNL